MITQIDVYFYYYRGGINMNLFRDQIQNYLSTCVHQKKLNEKTLKAYRIDLTQFDFFVTQSQFPFGKECLAAYISSLHDEYMPKTVKRKIASLRAFLNFLEFDEQLDENPLPKIRTAFKEPLVLPKTLPIKTIQKMLRKAYANTENCSTDVQYNNSLRNIAILELLFAVGIRVSELCSITAREIDLKSGAIKIHGKGARERIVYIMNKDTLASLKIYSEACKTEIRRSGWFFVNRLGNRLSEQSVRTMIKNLAKQTNLEERITPHMFRHSFATLLLEEDVDIRYIQSILGHSSITTTQIYTHVSAKKQRAILMKKHPRNKILL